MQETIAEYNRAHYYNPKYTNYRKKELDELAMKIERIKCGDQGEDETNWDDIADED